MWTLCKLTYGDTLLPPKKEEEEAKCISLQNTNTICTELPASQLIAQAVLIGFNRSPNIKQEFWDLFGCYCLAAPFLLFRSVIVC